MRKLVQIRILMFMFCCMIFIQVYAQSAFISTNYTKWYKFNNVVKITSVLPGQSTKTGFGFIWYEKNDSLYIVTAKHVVQSKTAKLTVNFYFINAVWDARVIELTNEPDIALIKTPKPRSTFAWEFRGNTKISETGDKIEIIGRYNDWLPLSKRMHGEIVRSGENEFEAKFYGAALGTSGGPVFSKNKIIGLITRDAGNSIYGITIQVIEKTVNKWLNMQPEAIHDLPLFSFGINMGISTRTIYSLNRYSLFYDKSNEPLSFRPGIFCEIAPFNKVSFSIETNHQRTYKKTNTQYSPYMEFKNHIFSGSFGINYNFYSNLSDAQAFTSLSQFLMQKVFLGYSWNTMKPKVKTADSEWSPLNIHFETLPDFSKNFGSVFFGLGSNNNFERFTFRFELRYEQYLSKYLSFDLIDPYSSNAKNDWFFSLNFKFGYMIRPKSSKVKLLR